MSPKSVVVGAFALALGAPSLWADAMGYVFCDPGGSSGVTLPGATGASVACGGDFAQGSLQINVSPNLMPFGSVSGSLTIPAVCDISLITPPDSWPPGCPLPYRGEDPNVGVYFNAEVTATGYTEGPPRPGYLVWSIDEPSLLLYTTGRPNWNLFEVADPIGGPGLWATIGPYSIQGYTPVVGTCFGEGPDGWWYCGSDYPVFAMPFELGVPFEVRFAFQGRAWAYTHVQTVTFSGEVFDTRYTQLTFLEASDVVPAQDPWLPGWATPAPGATPVPAYLVPEPSSLWLLGLGVALVLGARGRKRAKLE